MKKQTQNTKAKSWNNIAGKEIESMNWNALIIFNKILLMFKNLLRQDQKKPYLSLSTSLKKSFSGNFKIRQNLEYEASEHSLWNSIFAIPLAI